MSADPREAVCPKCGQKNRISPTSKRGVFRCGRCREDINVKPDYYAVLGVHPTATAAEIKDRVRLLRKAWHPDKFGQETKAPEEIMKGINEAYAVLSNESERFKYDYSRRAAEKDTRTAPPPPTSEPPPTRPPPKPEPDPTPPPQRNQPKSETFPGASYAPPASKTMTADGCIQVAAKVSLQACALIFVLIVIVVAAISILSAMMPSPQPVTAVDSNRVSTPAPVQVVAPVIKTQYERRKIDLEYILTVYADADTVGSPLSNEIAKVAKQWEVTHPDLLARDDTPSLVTTRAAMNIGRRPLIHDKALLDEDAIRRTFLKSVSNN